MFFRLLLELPLQIVHRFAQRFTGNILVVDRDVVIQQKLVAEGELVVHHGVVGTFHHAVARVGAAAKEDAQQQGGQ